jgi:hypothetical protein
MKDTIPVAREGVTIRSSLTGSGATIVERNILNTEAGNEANAIYSNINGNWKLNPAFMKETSSFGKIRKTKAGIARR